MEFDPFEPVLDPAGFADETWMAELRRRRSVGLDVDQRLLPKLLEGTRFSGATLDSLALETLTSADVRDGTAAVIVNAVADMTSGYGAEGLANLLSTPVVAPLAADIVDLFPRVSDVHARWRVGEVIERIASPNLDTHVPQIVELLGNPAFGRSREMLAMSLPKIDTQLAASAALQLLGTDPQIDGHLLSGLARNRVRVHDDKLAVLAADKRAWVRKLARRITKRQAGEAKPQ